MEETKVIYHLNDEDTPYLIKLPIGADRITLGDLKNALGRPNYKYFFKSMDDDFGVVKEEIGDDGALLPCFNGRVVSWLVASDSSVSDTHSQCAESVTGDTQKEKQDGRPLTSFRTQDGPGHDRHEVADPVSNKRKDGPIDGSRAARDQQSRSHHLPARSHGHRRSERQRCPAFDPGSSSVMSSDIETTSFVDSDDDASSRFTATTETTAASSKYGHLRQRRRRHRLPVMTRASSFSSITDSTMSLNIVTVTLNLDVVKFLGISIVGQSNKGGDGGIYVGSIMKGGAVALDGRIEPGDMILEVNDISFENLSNDEAVRVLREVVQKNGPVKLVVAKCWDPNPRGYFITPPAQEPIRPIDPSAWVAHTEAIRSRSFGGGMYGPVGLPFGSATSAGSSVTGSMPDSELPFTSLCLTVQTDLAVVAKAMARPDSGLEIRNRMWLKITIPHAFIGSDLIDWLLSHVKGLADRRDARKYANNLLKMGCIRHTVNKLNFSEQCYYTIGETIAPVPGLSYQTEITEVASCRLPASLQNLSSLALDDIDSVSEVNQRHSHKSASAWVNQFTTNPYGPSYVSQPLGYVPPPPYNLVTGDRSHSSGSNKPNEATHSGSGSSASGSSRSQGGHKRAPLMSGSEIGDSVSVLSGRRYSPSEKSQMMLDPSQQQSFNMPVTHPYLNDNLEIMGDL